ncbi:hypothetical protein NL676_025994 [Syzygium grande]|nr:hypothetical protein NL676_025994 [Syzygium grande]
MATVDDSNPDTSRRCRSTVVHAIILSCGDSRMRPPLDLRECCQGEPKEDEEDVLMMCDLRHPSSLLPSRLLTTT